MGFPSFFLPFPDFFSVSQQLFWIFILRFFVVVIYCDTETEQEIFEKVLHGDLDFSADPWPNISESAKDLVRKMLVRNPRKRLTAQEVLCESLCCFCQIFWLIHVKSFTSSELLTRTILLFNAIFRFLRQWVIYEPYKGMNMFTLDNRFSICWPKNWLCKAAGELVMSSWPC